MPGISCLIKHTTCVCVCVCAHACTRALSHFSHVRLLATLWTIAFQAPLSIRFSGREYWSGLSCPPLEDLPQPGMETLSLISLISCIGSLPLLPRGKPKIHNTCYQKKKKAITESESSDSDSESYWIKHLDLTSNMKRKEENRKHVK